MKKYTQEDFDNFEIDENGFRICPIGDYTLIKGFGEECRFAGLSSFGEGCRFAGLSSFGEGCRFAGWSSFGKRCSFGEGASFGRWSSFGEECRFGEKTIVEGKYKLINMKKIDCIGSRNGCTYFFNCEEGIMVRCGCFFGTLEEFEQEVLQKYPEEESRYHKEYIGAINYIKSILD